MDVVVLMVHVGDVVLEVLFSVLEQIAAVNKNIVAHSKCCFELFGFDILIHTGLKSRLLEVNLSPVFAVGCCQFYEYSTFISYCVSLPLL
uniref:Tubulin--tyrosine ligase-like protein 5 n=1 Tax=Onchocerca volvulus TaxID=6282 RepID=A0A8R1XSA0_ONCVO